MSISKGFVVLTTNFGVNNPRFSVRDLLYHLLSGRRKSMGYRFLGYVKWCLLLLGTLPILSCRRIVRALGSDIYDSTLSQQFGSLNDTRRNLQVLTPLSHLVKNLPGLDESERIVHYAGHLSVDEEKGGNIFYWLIEAQTVDPAKG